MVNAGRARGRIQSSMTTSDLVAVQCHFLRQTGTRPAPEVTQRVPPVHRPSCGALGLDRLCVLHPAAACWGGALWSRPFHRHQHSPLRERGGGATKPPGPKKCRPQNTPRESQVSEKVKVRQKRIHVPRRTPPPIPRGQGGGGGGGRCIIADRSSRTGC